MVSDQDAQAGAGELSTAEFDAWYRGELDVVNEHASFEVDCVPWDIGAPQPALVETERSGQIRSEVLDIGCGPGDNALFLADRGYRVVALDGAPTVIEQARSRTQPGQNVEFAVGDATRLAGYEGWFSTVVDSALYHCLTEEQQADYLAAIHRATVPGAVLHLMCFSDAVPDAFPAPQKFSAEYLRESLASHWDITSIERAQYITAFTAENVARMTGHAAESVDTDEQGRVLVPMWAVAAERK